MTDELMNQSAIDRRLRRSAAALAGGCALACLTACSGDDRTLIADGTSPAPAAEEPGTGASAGPVYALSTLVWGVDGATGYVTLSDTLDLERVSLEGAREFPGYTTVAVADGQLMVTNAENPIIYRFGIDAELQWEDRGRLSLINQGVTDSGFYRQYVQRDQVAYAEIDVGQSAVWDPVAFQVEGTEVASQLVLQRDGLDLFANYNRAYFVFDGPIVRPFSYHDQDWFRWAPGSLLVVYDPDTNTERSVIESPCPGLDTITRDERGNLYFSTWEYPALHVLAGSGAAPCVTRVTPDGTLDATWAPDLTAWTGGRPVMNFRYIGQGKAIGAVLHTEKFGDSFDFAAAFAEQDAFWDAYGLNYRLWMFDLDAGSATPVRGLPDEDLSPNYSHAELDGRTFLLREANDFSHTTVYELGTDGEATQRFEVIGGSSYQWVKLR
ncbi:MAG TPA: hypothetical protein VMG12_26840 [Polyangiaceae bacterium]|nr:hypothetical protein [Polyangiaceae bacterium]